MIKLYEVSKSFGELELFKDLTMNFPLGKKILIKGVNGSGKSVLLKLLVGYSSPNFGRITIDGLELGKDFDFIPNSGVSINAPEFSKNMTGRKNLLYLADIKKIANEEKILKLSRMLEMEKNIDKLYINYSLGMKQKLRIMQAIMDEPKYLILDEPFDALDQKSQEKVKDMLNDYITDDKILIFTSHNINHEEFADMTFEINDKKLVQAK